MTHVILDVNKIKKSFQLPDRSTLTVLEDLSFKLEKGTIIAVTGASGSGKSTLLHLIGGLDNPDEGEIMFQGENILEFDKKKKSEYRNQSIGFIFQFHYLMPELNVIENVSFPFLMKNFDKEKAFERAKRLIEDVGLADKSDYMTYQLSGGERQRAAIARSLINSPKLLLADEPTGNVDWKTGKKVFNIFKDLVNKKGLTAIIVTHNEKLAKKVDKTYNLNSGKLFL
jgi:lipoprotein-releasing system ATP-binding protein